MTELTKIDKKTMAPLLWEISFLHRRVAMYLTDHNNGKLDM